MPTLEWIGKNKVVNHHQEVPFRVLERQYSFDEQGQHTADNGSENMIIHGDNLEALKALLPQYESKVKCIYIDPPYNTGNEGWCYNDNVSDPRIQKWLGEVVGKEGEDLTRHDKWLCMMYPRLMLLQKLLNAVDDTELQRYVDYIIDGMNQDQLDALEQMPVNFANKICDYIIKLQEETARENFYNWLEVGKIVTQPRFKLTPLITLSGKASSLTKSLYKQECELDDNFEYDMAMALTGIDSVRWWHRNPTSGRNAFCLNAFRNHYPDFIVMTNSGKVLLVETKGDQLENAESREKIKLGRAWQNTAGSQYRYYMVFQNKDLHLEGAYRFDEFLKILGEL